MDIDDILREADPEYYSKPGDDGDLEALTRAWVAERSAPELLEYVSYIVTTPKKYQKLILMNLLVGHLMA